MLLLRFLYLILLKVHYVVLEKNLKQKCNNYDIDKAIIHIQNCLSFPSLFIREK